MAGISTQGTVAVTMPMPPRVVGYLDDVAAFSGVDRGTVAAILLTVECLRHGAELEPLPKRKAPAKAAKK